ncbi:MAG: putative bifunctional diguanylate cyclase/phosphodiesterase [Dehalococcoidia bacterium]
MNDAEEMATRMREFGLRQLFWRARDAIIVADAQNGRISLWNPAAEALFGYTSEEALQLTVDVLVPERPRAQNRAGLAFYAAGGHGPLIDEASIVQLPALTKDGLEISIELTLTPVDGPLQENRYVLAIVRDISERRQVESALRVSEERFRSLVQHATDVISVLDADRTLRYISPSVERVLGCQAEELIGEDALERIHPDDAAHGQGALRRAVNQPEGLPPPAVYRMRHRDGSWRYLETTIANLLDDPSVAGLVLTSRDIGERIALDEQLTSQTLYDPLTGLPNRGLFIDRLKHAFAAAQRRKSNITVLFLDLDDFKVVNDSLGHASGDDLLIAVARRLSSFLRSSDTVARFSGDEFALLIEQAPYPSASIRLAERVIAAFRQPFLLGEREIALSASIGVAHREAAAERTEPEDLTREADTALYHAKAGGKGRLAHFEPGMSVAARERLEFFTDLRRAEERLELKVVYLPEVDLASGSIVGMEALVRWQHPVRGLLSPGAFIALAEETGVIVPIGRWVLNEACHQMERWQAARSGGPSLVLSVNLSAREVEQRDLVAHIERILRETGLDPRQLRLELSESVLLREAASTVRTLQSLKEFGISLVLDDFGTGYSSLGFLRRFPVDTVKIDGSFIREMTRDSGAAVIVNTIITLADAFGLDVTAEGIETQRQLTLLRRLRCPRGQGFLFSQPLSGEALGAVLQMGLNMVPS